jgi:glutaredoxin
MSEAKAVLYGNSDTCPPCRMALAALKQSGIPTGYFNTSRTSEMTDPNDPSKKITINNQERLKLRLRKLGKTWDGYIPQIFIKDRDYFKNDKYNHIGRYDKLVGDGRDIGYLAKSGRG